MNQVTVNKLKKLQNADTIVWEVACGASSRPLKGAGHRAVIFMDEYVSRRLSEKVRKAYEHAEMLKLAIWDMVECEQDELEWSGEINPEERFFDAEATYDARVLKITVNDVLPRKQSAKPVFKSAAPLRNYWVRNIAGPIRKLGQDIHFNEALCVIKVYTPSDREWDVDNRALSMIINALRFTGVVAGDSWDKVSLVLLGGVDKKRPRTEIWVRECPADIIERLLV